MEKNEESSDSEFSDYEVIYDYVESTYAHGDAHDMTEVKGKAEEKGTAEVKGTEELGTIEAEGTVEAEVVDEKQADAVTGTVDVDVEKQEIDEVVALADMDKDNSLEILEDISDSHADSRKHATEVEELSSKSDRSPISEDRGEETSVKTVEEGNIDEVDTEAIEKAQARAEVRPKVKVKKRNKAREEIEPEPPPVQRLRRSDRERKPPAWHDSYQINNMVVRQYEINWNQLIFYYNQG